MQDELINYYVNLKLINLIRLSVIIYYQNINGLLYEKAIHRIFCFQQIVTEWTCIPPPLCFRTIKILINPAFLYTVEFSLD